MREDVERVIKQCGTCERNTFGKVLNHPAIAIKVHGIFDTLHVDCVWGLEESAEGFTGLLTLFESFSAFPGAYPLRTKTKVEIGRNLRNWISFFGPPKCIMSDQGTEFINDVVDGMCDNLGIPHKITSAYHPRTNGKVERLNQTLIASLRRMVENNLSLWPEMLDFVLLALRTRVNTRTGFTPYELVYGVRCAKFGNWRAEQPENEIAEILQRSNQIKDLVEVTRPMAKENSDNQQE